MSVREPRWDHDWELGRQGELLCDDIAKAFANGASREVKTDMRAADTGRIYVEYECFRQGEWRPSGIKTSEAEYQVFVLGNQALLVFPRLVLLALARRAWMEGHKVSCLNGSHPTRGVAIPLRDIPAWTLDI